VWGWSSEPSQRARLPRSAGFMMFSPTVEVVPRGP
jgi:hypothetical protein